MGTSTLILAVAALLIAVVTLMIEWLIRRDVLNYFVGRKLLHIIAVSVCAYVIAVYDDAKTLGYLFMGLSGLLYIIITKGRLLVQNDTSLGIALFPLGLGTMLVSGWFEMQIVSVAAWILAIADPMAGLVGRYSKAKTYVFIGEGKSFVGTSAFIIASMVVLWIVKDSYIEKIFVISLIIGLSELFSTRGSDNFSILWVAGLMLSMMDSVIGCFSNEVKFCILMAALGILAYWRQWLDLGGVMAAWLVGAFVALCLDPIAIYAPSFLLVSGSLIPRLLGKKKSSSPRNARQVWANGLMAIVCLIIYKLSRDDNYIVFFFAAISISICDTVSSEIGTIIKGKTVDIITWRPMQSGLSGGISWQGTLAGMIAVVLYILGCYFLFRLTLWSVFLIFIIGFVGMLVDSYLGSKYQALYSVKGDYVEDNMDNQSQLIKGSPNIDNNMVNVLSHIITMAMVIMIYEVWHAFA